MKVISTIIGLLAVFNYASATICADGSTCPGISTCCLTPRGVGCCPYANANCCGNGLSCCPAGTQCDASGTRCLRGNGNDFFTQAAAPISTQASLAFLDKEEEEKVIVSQNFNKQDK